MIKFSLTEDGQIPVRGSAGAAGLDIHASEDNLVPALVSQLIKTGVYLHELPPNTYLRIAPRSKMASKFGIDVAAGVVDSDYRGEIMVLLRNTSVAQYVVRKGDAIAQLICERCEDAECEILPFEEMSTCRGSSGINSEELRR